MQLNPQLQTKIYSPKFSSLSKIVSFHTFQKQKQERKNIEEERKNIELNVAHLYRQTKKASKQLAKTQITLVQNLNRKSSKQQEQRLIDQFKRLKEGELHLLQNNNSVCRYMNMLKREEAKRRVIDQNRELTIYIKQRQKHDQTIKKIKQLDDSRLTFQKNLALGKTLKIAVQLAKAKKNYQNKCLSSNIRNELLEIENKKIEKERLVIKELTSKKNQLKELFDQAQQQKHKYQTILDVGKSRSFLEMYKLVAAKEDINLPIEKKKKRPSRKHKQISQTKIKSFYLGESEVQ